MNEGPVSSVLKLQSVRVNTGVRTTTLEPGDIETFRVAHRNSVGRVRLVSARFTVTARDGGLLTVGDLVRLRLVSSAPRVRFQLERPLSTAGTTRDIPSFLRAAGFPVDRGTTILAETIIRSGRALSAELIRAARTIWKRLRRGDPIDSREARIRVEMADRGIGSADERAIAALAPYLWGFGDTDTRHGRDESTQRNDSGTGTLEEYLRRETDKPDSIVQLMNALAPTGDHHWVTIPIAATRGTSRVEAVLRVSWNLRSGRAERAIVYAGAEDGDDQELVFEIDLPSATIRKARFRTEVSPASIRTLQGFLSSLHSEAEPSTMVGDGFDLDETTFTPGSLDRYG